MCIKLDWLLGFRTVPSHMPWVLCICHCINSIQFWLTVYCRSIDLGGFKTVFLVKMPRIVVKRRWDENTKGVRFKGKVIGQWNNQWWDVFDKTVSVCFILTKSTLGIANNLLSNVVAI